MSDENTSSPVVERISNAMTVDVEDYYHVTALSSAISRSSWASLESRVDYNTKYLLDWMEQWEIKGTYFILGWVAERNKGLVTEIVKRGHEVACHGYSHELVYRQNEKTFLRETEYAKGLLEDLTQEPILGYRAASYSITKHTLWALDVLVELGFVYDSSIYPIRHDTYGINGMPRFPYHMVTPKGNRLLEVPLSTVEVFGFRIPVGGGGYFRIYPYWLTRMALQRINGREGKPFVFYLHPWEIDVEQPRFRARPISRFRHYTNLRKTISRLECLTSDFRFTSLRRMLNSKLQENGNTLRAG